MGGAGEKNADGRYHEREPHQSRGMSNQRTGRGHSGWVGCLARVLPCKGREPEEDPCKRRGAAGVARCITRPTLNSRSKQGCRARPQKRRKNVGTKSTRPRRREHRRQPHSGVREQSVKRVAWRVRYAKLTCLGEQFAAYINGVNTTQHNPTEPPARRDSERSTSHTRRHAARGRYYLSPPATDGYDVRTYIQNVSGPTRSSHRKIMTSPKAALFPTSPNSRLLFHGLDQGRPCSDQKDVIKRTSFCAPPAGKRKVSPWEGVMVCQSAEPRPISAEKRKNGDNVHEKCS